MESRETQAKTIKLPTFIDSRPDVSMTIRNLVDPMPAGEASDYVIVLENHGSKTASDVAVKVDLPNNWVAISQENATLETPLRSLSFTVPTIAAKEKKEMRFKAGSNVPGEYIVRAKLTFGDTNISLTAEDSVLVFKSNTQRLSEKSGPNVR
jgi:hypothetical protein